MREKLKVESRKQKGSNALLPFLLSLFLLSALAVSAQTFTRTIEQPATDLTNGVCLFIEPVLGTAFDSNTVATVRITLPAEGTLIFRAGSVWMTNRIGSDSLQELKKLNGPEASRFDGSKKGKLK